MMRLTPWLSGRRKVNWIIDADIRASDRGATWGA